MEIEQRRISIVTSLGKRYCGMIDIPNAAFRTTDLLNSANLFWKNPNDKCYNNAILMYDVKLYIEDSAVFKKFDKIQVKLSEIFYFYDELENIGNEREKKWADSVVKQSLDSEKTVQIVTRNVANSFYFITGTFFGLFRKKSNDKFIPLSKAQILEIYKHQDKWAKKKIFLPHNFIAVCNEHIESVTLSNT